MDSGGLTGVEMCTVIRLMMWLQWLLVVTLLGCTAVQASSSVRHSDPVIVEHPEDQFVAKNEPATLNCKAEGEPPPVITWYRNGQPVITANENPSSHRMLLPSGQLFFLRIIHNKNSKPDVGVYYCNATNPQTHVSAISRNATLEISVLGGEFREQPHSMEVVSGADVVLECKPPKGEPEARVRWRKDNDPVKVGDRFTVMESGSLRIREVRKEDSGVYVCIAYNIGGEKDSGPAKLTVREKPLIVEGPKDIVTFENQEVVFQCRASGDPEPTIVWSKMDDQMPQGRAQIQDDRSLRIERARATDEGVYLCHAENSVGFADAEAKLTVHSQPSFIVTPRDKVVGAGRRVVMRCEVTGNPVPAVFWNKESSQVLMFPNQDHGRMSVTEDGYLVIDPVLIEDSGEYICKGLSIAGSAYAKARLDVKDIDSRPPPIIYQGPQNQTLPVNSVATMPCSATGEPNPTISWYRNQRGVQLRDPRFNLLDSGTLQITDLRKTDSGLYTCKATSETGESTWSAHLVVETSLNPSIIFHRTPEPSTFPGPPTKPTVGEVTESSVRLTWKANSNHGASPVVAYTVEYFSHETGEGWVIASDMVPDQAYVVHGLRSDTPYMFLVRAQNSHGLSLPSHVTPLIKTKPSSSPIATGKAAVNLDIVTEKLKSVGLVTLHQAEPLNSTSVRLTWELRRHQRFVDGFIVSYRSSVGGTESSDATSGLVMSVQPSGGVGGAYSEKRVTGSGVTSYTLTDLKKFTWYEVVVRPFYQSVVGLNSSALRVRTLEDVPSSPPVNIQATMVDNTTMHLTWEPPPPQHLNGPLMGYKIYLYDSEVRYSREISLNSSLEAIYVHQMDRQTNYQIQMSAVNRKGEGSRSELILIGTPTDVARQYIAREPWFIATLIGAIGSIVWLLLCLASVYLFRRCRRCKNLSLAGVTRIALYSPDEQNRMFNQQNAALMASYIQKEPIYYNDCNGYQRGPLTSETQCPSDSSQPSTSRGSTTHHSALPTIDAPPSAPTEAVFRPIHRPYTAASSQDDSYSKNDDDMSYMDSDDDILNYADDSVFQNKAPPLVHKQPILFLPPPPQNPPPPSDINSPPESPTPRRHKYGGGGGPSTGHQGVGGKPTRKDRHGKAGTSGGSGGSGSQTGGGGQQLLIASSWNRTALPQYDPSVCSPHAMSEPDCAMLATERVVLNDRQHFSDTDGPVTQPTTVLLHEFCPPSPAPQDSLLGTTANNARSRSHRRPLTPESPPPPPVEQNSRKLIGSAFNGSQQEHRCLESDVSDGDIGASVLLSDGEFIDNSSAVSSDMSSCLADNDYNIYTRSAHQQEIIDSRDYDRVKRPSKHRSNAPRSSSPDRVDYISRDVSSGHPGGYYKTAPGQRHQQSVDRVGWSAGGHTQSASRTRAPLDAEAYIYNRAGALHEGIDPQCDELLDGSMVPFRTNPLSAFDTRDTAIV